MPIAVLGYLSVEQKETVTACFYEISNLNNSGA